MKILRTFLKIIFRYRGVQGRTGASRGVQGRPGASRGVQGRPGASRGVQGQIA